MACNSILQALTPQDFKDQFPDDFNYLPVWSADSFYNINEIVYYESTRLFYRCLSNGVTALPTDATYWVLYPSGNIRDYISDSQITKAFKEACISFNPALTGDNEEMIFCYLYLAAFYLVFDVSAGGIRSTTAFNVNSRSVGNVSESYSVPDWALKNPQFSMYSKNAYGMKYLNMISPRAIGNVVSVYGGTRA